MLKNGENHDFYPFFREIKLKLGEIEFTFSFLLLNIHEIPPFQRTNVLVNYACCQFYGKSPLFSQKWVKIFVKLFILVISPIFFVKIATLLENSLCSFSSSKLSMLFISHFKYTLQCRVYMYLGFTKYSVKSMISRLTCFTKYFPHPACLSEHNYQFDAG